MIYAEFDSDRLVPNRNVVIEILRNPKLYFSLLKGALWTIYRFMRSMNFCFHVITQSQLMALVSENFVSDRRNINFFF